MKMRSGQVGDISELMVISALMRKNREVALPYGNRPGYDILVLDSEGCWREVQIKTAKRRAARPGGGVYCDFIRGSGKGRRRHYTPDDFSFLISVEQQSGDFWVFTSTEVSFKRCLTVDKNHVGYMAINRI